MYPDNHMSLFWTLSLLISARNSLLTDKQHVKRGVISIDVLMTAARRREIQNGRAIEQVCEYCRALTTTLSAHSVLLRQIRLHSIDRQLLNIFDQPHLFLITIPRLLIDPANMFPLSGLINNGEKRVAGHRCWWPKTFSNCRSIDSNASAGLRGEPTA